MRTAVVLTLAVFVCAGGTAAFRYRARWRPAADPARAAPVRPPMRPAPSAVTSTGSIRLQVGAQVRVGAQVSGIVQRLHVSVGSHVEKGDVIAEIDTRAIEAKIAQARAQSEMDRVTLEKDRLDYARSQALLADGLIARQQAQDLEWQVNQSQARLAKSQSDLAASQVDLGYAVIRAPISGTVASVSTQEGETVAASFSAPTFVTIVENNALELVAMVDETDIGSVRPGQRVTFTTEAFPARELKGIVSRINPTATIISGVVNYEVVVDIGNAAGFLKPDMTANVTIYTTISTNRRRPR